MTNSGTRLGHEVVQLYAPHVGSRVTRPVKGYRRLTLRPGETRTVQLPLATRAFAYWHAGEDRWIVDADRVRLLVGASSADIKLEKTILIGGGR